MHKDELCFSNPINPLNSTGLIGRKYPQELNLSRDHGEPAFGPISRGVRGAATKDDHQGCIWDFDLNQQLGTTRGTSSPAPQKINNKKQRREFCGLFIVYCSVNC